MALTGLTIGAAAEAAGLTRKAVKVYEAKGLLPRAERTPAGYRLYDQHDIELLTFIRRARALGLRLEDIREILAIRGGAMPPCAAIRDMLDERITDIDTTIAELRSLRRTLADTRTRADDCCTDDRTATICTVIDDA
jgi:DNA-binding transcriptional MerR regulator